MTMYYVFDSLEDAQEACAVIDAAMGLPNHDTKTLRWALPEQRATDDKFIVQVPPIDIEIDAPIEELQSNWRGIADE